MAFAFVAAGTTYDSSSSSSAVVDMPTGVAADDFLLAYLAHTGAVSNSIPTGWTHLADTDTVGDGRNRAIYYRIAGGSEPADYTWGYAAAGRLAGKIAAYRDEFDTADPIDVFSDTAYTTNDTNLRAAGMTVSAANSPLIFVGGVADSLGTFTFTSPTVPTTFNEDLDVQTGANSRESFTFASVKWTSSGATGNMDATMSASAGAVKHAFAVALNPAAAGGADPEGRLVGGKLVGRGLLGGVLT